MGFELRVSVVECAGPPALCEWASSVGAVEGLRTPGRCREALVPCALWNRLGVRMLFFSLETIVHYFG